MTKLLEGLGAAARDGFYVLDDHLTSDDLVEPTPDYRLSAPVDLWAAASQASPWSLTGRYGRGAFPWHTDGAIARRPPRFVVLQNITVSAVPTELATVSSEVLGRLASVALRARDRYGHTRLLSAVERTVGGSLMRWDPRACPVAAGPRGVESLMAELPTEFEVGWDHRRTMIIDNWRVLHRRPHVPEVAQRGLRRWYLEGVQ